MHVTTQMPLTSSGSGKEVRKAKSPHQWSTVSAAYAEAKRAEDAFYARHIDSFESQKVSNTTWSQAADLTNLVSAAECDLMAVPSPDLRALALKVTIACVENGTVNHDWLVILESDAKRLLAN